MIALSPPAPVVATTVQPENLGPFASAVEAAPVPSLTGAGLVLGGLWGAITAWSFASLIKSKNVPMWTWAGAAAGGIVLGFEGYTKGQELNSWLQDHS